MSTKIQWTEETWNPVQGCFKVSPGCKNCYAIRQVVRLSENPNEKIARRYHGITSGMNWTGKCGIDEEVLLQPLRRRKPTTYFISLSDLFYDKRHVTHIWKVLAVASQCREHTFQILTKYPERMCEIMSDPDIEDRVDEEGVDLGWCHANAAGRFPLPNVWLGVSVEDQQHADERIPLLLRTPAAVRFVSYEPALGPVDFRKYLPPQQEVLAGKINDGYLGGPYLGWIIYGHESGPGARPGEVAWARAVKNQCVESGTPFFLKQFADAKGRKIGTPVLDGQQWMQMPEPR
jgi:protein gp37